MENSALNAAHAKERRAEALVRERKFDEAAKCHEQAAYLFAQIHKRIQTGPDDLGNRDCDNTNQYHRTSLTSPQLKTAIEAIQLQKEHHHKQAAFVRMKQAQYEDYLAMKEMNEKDSLAKHAMKYRGKGSSSHFGVDNADRSLPQAIDKAMEEQDSLLEFILTPQNGNVGVKLPKDPGAVLEELRTVNGQLRALIGSLLGQLEASQMQVRVLTEKLRAVSVDDDVSTVVTNEDSTISLSPLPPLAPLEMPPFEFSTS